MKLAFYYRGGVTYDAAMWMSAYERQQAMEWHAEYLENELNIRPMAPNY